MASSDKLALLEPQAEVLLADDNVAPWILVWQHRGLTHCQDKICAYYSNLGLVAALIGTICATIVVDPPLGRDEWVDTVFMIQGTAGILGFASAIGAVIDCILIANTCGHIASDRQLLFFLKGQSRFLSRARQRNWTSQPEG